MAKSSYPAYKEYRRQKRVQVSETSYLAGMLYTQEPLPIGTFRRLDNVDIKDDGATLYPRSGLQETGIVSTNLDEDNNILTSISIPHKIGILNQFICGKPTNTGTVLNQKLIALGNASMIQDQDANGTHTISTLALNDPETKRIGLVKAETDPSEYTWKPIGCYAGNSSYLFFRYFSGV